MTGLAFAVRRRNWLAAFGLCAITLLVYANSFDAGFVLDNEFLLHEDRIQAATVENLRLIWEHTYWWPVGESGLYRPFTTLTYLFNYAILGNNSLPAGYHWINLILHAGNVLLAYAVALRLFRRFELAVGTAALWAVHPLLAEAVTNIVGRAELLSGTTVLGGFLLYVKSTEVTGWRRWAALGGLAVVTAIGVFSKESAVMVVAVVALYEATWWTERHEIRGFLRGLGAMFPAIAAMLAQRWVVLGAGQPALFPFVDNPLVGAGFWVSRLTAVEILARYLGLVVWPAKLSCDYSYSQIPLATGSFEDWLAWGTMAALAVGMVWVYKRNRVVFFFAAFAFLTLLPGANLILRIGTVMAERLMYLPAFGAIACLAVGLDWLARQTRFRWAGPLLVCVIACALGARTWARNPDWRTQVTLGEATVQASPKSFKAYGMLASALYDEDPIHENLDREIAVSERGVALLDSLPDARNTWRSYSQTAGYYQKKAELLGQKRWDGSLAPARESLAAWQKSADLLVRSIAIIHAEPKPVVPKGVFVTEASLSEEYRSLSIANSHLGKSVEALDAAVKSRDADPMYPPVYGRLSVTLLDLGRAREGALALLEGWALTGDQGLDAGLAAIYRKHADLDPEGCGVVAGLGVTSHDPACGAVRVLRCEAMASAVVRARGMGRKVRADRIVKESGVWACSGGSGPEALEKPGKKI